MNHRVESIWMGMCVAIMLSSGAFIAVTVAPKDEPSVDETVISKFEPQTVKVDDTPASARVRYVSFDGADLCVSLAFDHCFGCHVSAKASGVDGDAIGNVEHDVKGDELSEFELRVPVGEDGWFEVAKLELGVKGAALQPCDVDRLVMDAERAIAEQLSSEAAALIDVSKSGMLERREADKAAAERARQEVAEAKRRAEEEARERAKREEEEAVEAARRAEEEASRRSSEPVSQVDGSSSSNAAAPVPAVNDVERKACELAAMRAGGQTSCVVIDLSSSTLYGCGDVGGTWSVGRTAHVTSMGSFGAGDMSVLRKAPEEEYGAYDSGGSRRWFMALSERFGGMDAAEEEDAGRYVDGYGWWYATGICSDAMSGDGNICLGEDDAKWLYSVCDVGTPVIVVNGL